jgi:acetyl esterase
MPQISTHPATGASTSPASAMMASAALAAPRLDPTARAFVDGLAGSPPIPSLTPDAARALLSGAQAAVNVPLADVAIKDVTLPVGPTGLTDIRVLRPQGATGVLPVIIYIHGGGWVLGGKDTHDRLVREITAGAGAALVFVDYQRSPEARFPTAIEQGYAVARYVADNAATLMVDAKRMVIAGDSVGGNMAAVIALLAKERKGPDFKAQLLFYPVTDASMSSESFEEFADGPWLTRSSMAWFWDQYLPDAAARDDVHASPINATTGELRDLPPTLLIVDENDVLRDEGEAYGRKLAAAGVRVTSFRCNGTIHDFMMLNALAATPAARGAIGQTIGYLRNVLATH